MRIAIAQRLTLAHGIRGGMETQAQALAAGLAARGHALLILTAPLPDGRGAGEECGVPVRYVAPGSHRWYQRRWWEACYRELVQQHHQAPFDVLLSHSAGALGYVERVACELHLPCVVILHGTLAGELRTRLNDIATPRGIYRLMRFASRAPGMLARWRRVVDSVDRWIAVAPQVAHDAAREIGMPADRISVIPNGIDTTRFQPDAEARARTRRRLGIAADAPLLIASGRLEREKGFDTAIAAVTRLRNHWPELRLLIAGGGRDSARLETLARPLGEAVQFVGHVPHAELASFLAAGDLYLMPTRCAEGLSLALIEALASGLPVLTTRSGGEAIIDIGRTGILLPPASPDAWADSIEHLLRHDRLRRAMGLLARQMAVARYSQERMVALSEAALMEAHEVWRFRRIGYHHAV